MVFLSNEKSELYGINNSNCDTILSKNIFTDYLPIAMSIYMMDNEIPHQYIKIGSPEVGQTKVGDSLDLKITKKPFYEILGVNKDNVDKINWKHEHHLSEYNKSINAPGIDIVCSLDSEEIIELEVKLTVSPHHRDDIKTEMIVRQNTQFAFAERIAYRFGEYLSQDVSVEDLERLIQNHANDQMPFIIHGLWKTMGRGPRLDETNTADVFVISDLAYLKMLLDSSFTHGGNRSRIGKVVDLIIEWLNQYKSENKINYLEEGRGIREHLKITLYPERYKENLSNLYEKLRLNINDMLDVVPPSSIDELSPERRLDNSLVFASEFISDLED